MERVEAANSSLTFGALNLAFFIPGVLDPAWKWRVFEGEPSRRTIVIACAEAALLRGARESRKTRQTSHRLNWKTPRYWSPSMPLSRISSFHCLAQPPVRELSCLRALSRRARAPRRPEPLNPRQLPLRNRLPPPRNRRLPARSLMTWRTHSESWTFGDAGFGDASSAPGGGRFLHPDPIPPLPGPAWLPPFSSAVLASSTAHHRRRIAGWRMNPFRRGQRLCLEQSSVIRQTRNSRSQFR